MTLLGGGSWCRLNILCLIVVPAKHSSCYLRYALVVTIDVIFIVIVVVTIVCVVTIIVTIITTTQWVSHKNNWGNRKCEECGIVTANYGLPPLPLPASAKSLSAKMLATHGFGRVKRRWCYRCGQKQGAVAPKKARNGNKKGKAAAGGR